jgi:hypothetical protein
MEYIYSQLQIRQNFFQNNLLMKIEKSSKLVLLQHCNVRLKSQKSMTFILNGLEMESLLMKILTIALERLSMEYLK